jgi:hypothetical protein
MRRLLASALLLLFGFLLSSPVILALDKDADPSLPACCRRAGRHGCTMQGQSSSGPAVKAPRCGSFPGAQTIPSSSKTALLPNLRGMVQGIPMQASPAQQAESLRRVAFDRTGQKRGPPSLS